MGEQQAQLISRLLPDGTLIFVNEAYCSFFAKKREELISHSFMSLILKEDQGKMQQSISSLGKENPISIHDYRFLADNGQVRWLQWANHATFDKEGALTELLAVGQDITERKQAEEELRRSEEKYRSLISNIPDVAWTSDENYNIVFIGPNIERLTGYTQAEEYKMGDWMAWYERVHPDAMEYAKTAFKALMGGKKHYDIEYRFQRKDGRWIWIHDRSLGTYEKNGALYADGLITDITERKQAEEERKELQEKAQLNSRLACIGQMASGMAHEINNPLTSIIGLTETMMQKGLSENIREHLKIVNDGAQRIAVIVSRLLAFARQQKPERTYVDVNEVIEATLALRAYALETGNIKVTSKLATDLPRTMANAGQLQQVFLNIILNAEYDMKSAHDRGTLLIKTENIDNTIRISFKNDGPGIARENLDKVFEPFFTTKPVGQGTGLGLSVCHGIVTAHNGQIYVRSQLGKGATFIVELPIVAKEEQ